MISNPCRLLLELDAWDAATTNDRIASAGAVAESLPKGFVFSGLSAFSLGDQSHDIAVFAFEDCTFVLIPGKSIATLGYDRTQPFQPTNSQLKDWQKVYDEFGCTIEEYLNQYLGLLRQATIRPLLVETVARNFKYARDGDDQTEGYNRIQAQCGEGFRLPTPDEWEYICAAGSRTLFRWGNECPISNSYDDKRFALHKQRNAFGVMMNSSTYATELCQGPALRGGDGGGSVCGGIGKIITWFPLASSFQVSQEEIDGWWIDDVFARRVLPIG